ncbi:MAG: hypothetical protein WKG07_21910 [Hymenobacter sp.]
MNTAADDFAPFFTGPGTGVFSSNREGGKGSDDLYTFKKRNRKMVTFYADGTVLERNEQAGTNAAVPSQTVTITSANGQPREVLTGPDGKFSVKLDSAHELRAARQSPWLFHGPRRREHSGPLPQPGPADRAADRYSNTRDADAQ